METHLLLNRITCRVPKAFLVISMFLIGTFLLLGNSTLSSKASEKDDYAFANHILNVLLKQSPNNTINFYVNNNNESVINMIKVLKANDFEQNSVKLDSIKQSLGITAEKPLKEIFNSKEYDFLLSQSLNSNWNFDKIKALKIIQYSKNRFVEKQLFIQISKPIYTQDKQFALVSVNKKSSSYILVFKRAKNEWAEEKLISPELH